MLKFLIAINKLFPKTVHPFNLANEGVKSYGEWQFEKGGETIRFFKSYIPADEMFKDKIVLDIGCGAAGKSLYYASLGAKAVYGIESFEKYEQEAAELAGKLGYADKFNFILGDASKMPFEKDFFDVIIGNDVIEHFDKPEETLLECMRVLKPDGRLYINFPPYNHPFGAHLSDVVGIPWVHCFFSDKTLIKAYKILVNDLPDGEERIRFRISVDNTGKEYFSYINKMTIKRFNRILTDININPVYYSEAPLRGFLKPFCRIMREHFVKMVVCVIQK